MNDSSTDANSLSAPETRPSGTLAIVSLSSGIIAIAANAVLLTGGAVLGILAIIVGVIALINMRRGVARGAPAAVAGVITGAIGAFGFVAFLFAGV